MMMMLGAAILQTLSIAVVGDGPVKTELIADTTADARNHDDGVEFGVSITSTSP